MKQVNETIRLAVGNGLTARTVISMALTTWVDHIEELHRFQCDYYGADSDNAGSTAVLLAEARTILGQLSGGSNTATGRYLTESEAALLEGGVGS